MDFGMFTAEGNRRVGELVNTAVEYSWVDGPLQPVKMARAWLLRELEALSLQPEFEEATDTAVREAAVIQFEKG